VEIAALQEFYKMIDSSQPPCGTYMGHILRSFQIFDLKSQRKIEFYKNTSSIIENRLNA
jgi:hypothetical protein